MFVKIIAGTVFYGLYATMESTSFLVKAADPQRLINWAAGRGVTATLV
jgi:hypothetical protein